MIPTRRSQLVTALAQTSRAWPSRAPKSSIMTGSKHSSPAYLKFAMTSKAALRKLSSPRLVELTNTRHRGTDMSSKRSSIDAHTQPEQDTAGTGYSSGERHAEPPPDPV